MHTQQHLLRGSTPGTQRELIAFHYGPEGGAKAYLQAGLHADELPGLLVLHHLRTRLAALESAGALRGRVVVVPVANPIGLSQHLLRNANGRFLHETGENFNRHFPALTARVAAAVEGALGEDAAANVAAVRGALRAALADTPAETEVADLRRTLMMLACDADIVLDLHCDFEAALHLYTGTPLWPQVEPLARLLGAQATLLATESGDDPFDEACSRPWWELAERFAGRHPLPLACAAVTVELRGMRDVSHAQAERDADALLDYLTLRGLIDGPAPALPPLQAAATPLAGSRTLYAPHAGVIALRREAGEWVREGDPLVDVIDPLSGRSTTLTSPTAGMLYAREYRRFATPGTWLVKVAGREAVRHGKLLSA